VAQAEHYGLVSDVGYFRVNQTTLCGAVLSQAIESVTPEAICAHAFSVAARWA